MSLSKEVNKDKTTIKEFRDMVRRRQAKIKELQRELTGINEWIEEFKGLAEEFKNEQL